MTLAAATTHGLLTGAGLIMAIGAQNALVLRQGARREHVVFVVALCTVSDVALIALGVFGLGSLIASTPWVLTAFRYGGAAFLLVYAAMAARRACASSAAALHISGTGASLLSTLTSALALTFLNPHVYLDTVILLGSIGAQHAGTERIAFAVGACLASAIWFALLGFGAAALAPYLRKPSTWRLMDAAVALLMSYLAINLLLE